MGPRKDMTHYFEPPFQVDDARSRTLSRKRKRQEAAATGTLDNQHEENDTAKEQRAEDDDFVPPPRFPHEPLKANKPNATRRSQSPDAVQTVKQQHMVVLNTVLHRCLLDHDWKRAGRAFGLLLRTEYRDAFVNLRRNGLWAIGAEILLQQGSDQRDKTARDLPLFTDQGFEAARAYYDRLILQYPFAKSRPQDLSATTFYPAMFGLWIHEIQARRERALQKFTAEEEAGREHPYDDQSVNDRLSRNINGAVQGDLANAPASSGENDGGETRRRRFLSETKQEELREAHKLAEHLNDLILAPPYDRQVDLLQLASEVTKWIAHLSEITQQPDIEIDRQHQRMHDITSRLEKLGVHQGQEPQDEY